MGSSFTLLSSARAPGNTESPLPCTPGYIGSEPKARDQARIRLVILEPMAPGLNTNNWEIKERWRMEVPFLVESLRATKWILLRDYASHGLSYGHLKVVEI
jgi:hypothetical protein